MSQGGKFFDGTALPDIETLTGDAGGAIGPDAAFNIDLLGDATQGISTLGAGNSITWTIADATTSQKGVGELATDAESISGAATTNLFINPSSLKAKLGIQTLHGIALGNATTGAINWTSEPSDGQIIIGKTGDFAVAANLSSSDSSITFATGAGTLGLTVTQATETQLGGAEVATPAEAFAYALDTVMLTPLKIKFAFSSPPPIGDVSPDTGAFTTLTSTVAGASGATSNQISIINSTATVADGGSALLWQLTASDAVAYDAGCIAVLSDGSTWTSTASSRDSSISLQNVLDGTLQEVMKIDSSTKIRLGLDETNALVAYRASTGAYFMSTNTVDGSDNSEFILVGGGSGNSTNLQGRGAWIAFAGNERASIPGKIRMTTGAIAGATSIFEVSTGASSTVGLVVDQNQATNLTKAGVSATTDDIFTLTNTTQTVADGGSAVLWNLHASDDLPYAAGRIAVLSDASTWTSTGTTQDSYMSFQTALDGSVSEAVRIHSDKKVSVGNYTDDAFAAFDVAFTGNTVNVIRASAGADTLGDVAGISFSTRGDNTQRTPKSAIFHIQAQTGSFGSGALAFAVGTTNASQVATSDEKMRIMPTTGYIGIATTSPITNFDVAGKIRATDALFVDEMWNGQAPEWATDVTTGSVAAQARQNGWLRLTSGATATNEESLDWGDITVCVNTLRPMVEVRLDLEQITLLEVEVGLKESEAVGTDDYIMIAFDPSAQNTWFLQASTAGATTTDQGAVADTNEVLLRFEFTSDTALEWFIDGVSQGTVATNVPTVALQPFIRIRTEENAAHYVDFDYFKIFQDRA